MEQQRVVVITGAAGGIGMKLVDRFLTNGDNVIAVDNRAPALQVLREGREVITKTCDVSNQVEVHALVNEIRRESGRVDVLVNCAGFYPVVPFEQMSFADWQQVIAVNLNGVFLMAHSMLPLMKSNGRGRIVNITSASIFEGVPGQTHYVSAKAGVVGFTRSLAMELGSFGITVNAVAPGLTVTDKVKETMEQSLIESQRPMRSIPRDEEPEDLAGAVFFFASPEADFISGQLLVVDGGKIKH